MAQVIPLKLAPTKTYGKKIICILYFLGAIIARLKKNVSVDQAAKINHYGPIHFNKAAQSVRTAKRFLAFELFLLSL